MCITLFFLLLLRIIPIFSYTTLSLEETTEAATSTTTLDTTATNLVTTTEQVTSQVPNEEFSPFQVSLHYSYNDDFICAGSIVSPKVVLTAAHCMYYRWGGLMPPIIVVVAAGRQRLNETAWRTFDVVNITLHPLFNKTSMDNDLALIEIEEIFEADSLINQIVLEKQVSSLDYSRCIVTGWNQDTYEFQAIEVTLVDCANYPNHICTNKKHPNNNLCINNSGNPLVCDNKLVGVLSVEPNCEDPLQLSIFENLRYSMSWLNESIGNGSSRVKMSFEYVRNLFVIHLILKLVFYVL